MISIYDLEKIQISIIDLQFLTFLSVDEW